MYQVVAIERLKTMVNDKNVRLSTQKAVLKEAPAIDGFHAISEDTNNNGEMNKCWWTLAKRANERSFVYRPPAWRR